MNKQNPFPDGFENYDPDDMDDDLGFDDDYDDEDDLCDHCGGSGWVALNDETLGECGECMRQ